MSVIDFHDPSAQRAFSLAATLLLDFPGIEAPVQGRGLAAQSLNSLLFPHLAGPVLIDLFRAWRPLNSDNGWRIEPDGDAWIKTTVSEGAWERDGNDEDEETTTISILIQNRPYSVPLEQLPTIFALVLPLLPERKAGGDVHNYRHTGRAAEKRFEKAWQGEMAKRQLHLMKARKYGLTCVGMSGTTYAFDPSPVVAIHLVNASDEAAFATAMRADLLVKMSVE